MRIVIIGATGTIGKEVVKMPAAQFVPAYQESVEGHRTGEVLDVRDFVCALSESV